jgi:hypothetical protein
MQTNLKKLPSIVLFLNLILSPENACIFSIYNILLDSASPVRSPHERGADSHKQ